MLIKRISFKNFLVFWREQEITLQNKDDQNSLVIILANNNTGKTSIIRGLKFLLYGDLPRQSKNCSEIINDRAIHEANQGDDIESYVEAEFVLEGKTHIYRRSVTCAKSVDGRTRGDTLLCRIEQGSVSTKIRKDENGVYAATLQRWLPKTLFDAFFFQGEPLDGKLMEGVDQIKSALSSFFRLERWDDAAEGLGKVKDFYNRQLADLASQSREWQKKREQLERNEILRDKNETRQNEIIVKLQELEGKQSQIESSLGKLGDTKEHDAALRELEEIRSKISAANRKAENIDNSLRSVITSSRGIPFLRRSIIPTREILKQMEKDNVLPAELTMPFVERVLNQETCVCGRKHDQQSCDAWNEYLKRTLNAGMNDLLMKTLNSVGESSPGGFNDESQETHTRICSLRKELYEIRKTLPELNRLKDAKEAKVKSTAKEGLKEQLDKLLNDSKSITRELRNLEGEKRECIASIKNLDFRHKSLKREADAAKPKGKLAQKIGNLETAAQSCGMLRRRILKFKTELHATFLTSLRTLVAHSYNPNATDKSTAEINEHSLLPEIVSPGGQIVNATGGGQNTLLSLAYVRALAIVRKEIHMMLKQLDIYLGQVDDQVFFIDSPFGAVDPGYTRNICNFLPESSKQVVVLLARQQWDQAGQHLASKADQVYIMKLHTPISELENLEPEDFDFKLGEKTFRLVEDCDNHEKRHTIIERVI